MLAEARKRAHGLPATSDTAPTRIADFLCRKFEAGHVRFHRVGELRGLLENAGLAQGEARSIWGGIYGLALAGK